MSDKPETLSAIIAEMRDFCSGWSEDVDVTVKVGIIYGWICRIEAAAERERTAHTNDIHDALYLATGIPGNAAAMREALTAFVDSIQWLCDGDERGVFKKQFAPLLSEARAALAAPARNCDVGDAAEQSERLAKFCKANYEKAKKGKHICSECRFNDCIGECPLKWAQLPFSPEKGGAE